MRFFRTTLSIILFISILSLLVPKHVFAQELAGASASPLLASKIPDKRVEKLEAYLKYRNSPLADYAAVFVAQADKYNLDYRLVPAIAGVESTFGKQIPTGSYNAYGWNGGRYAFKSWEDSIVTVSYTLRTKYIDKWGADSIEEMSAIYAPPSTTWAGKVTYFMKQIEDGPKTQTKTLALTLAI
jgi:hypothetical protein